MELNFQELLEGLQGEVIVNNSYKTFNDVSIDTRKIKKDNIYIALNGENFNGNKYAKEALEKGASIAVIDQVFEEYSNFQGLGIVIKVKNTYDSLLSLGNYYRNKLGLKVIGVTGSTGKTSTKDLVAALLSDKYKVFKTKGNFNNEVGMPLMIFQLDSSYDIAVLELGMSDLGEIHRLAKCCRPDIALITNVGVSHLENLKTRENILKAKMEITDFFGENNVLIVNCEDKYLPKISSESYKLIRTGYGEELNYWAKDIKLSEEDTSFTVVDNKEEFNIVLPMVGKHNVLNALISIAAAKELEVSYEEMVKGLKNIEATSMRLQFMRYEGYTVINDCYNSSPDSMKAALDVLNTSEGRRKIAVLGDMNELGEESSAAHCEVGEYAGDKCDVLLVCGREAKSYLEGFKGKEIKAFDSKDEVVEYIKNHLSIGDIILVKASRGVKFEEIVEGLKDLTI